MEYCEFIDKINSGKIKKFYFSVLNYSHYSDCLIEYKIDHPKNNVSIKIIMVTLTKDETEKVGFYENFDEKYKLFNFKRKGKFTLKQIWKDILIKYIEYTQMDSLESLEK